LIELNTVQYTFTLTLMQNFKGVNGLVTNKNALKEHYLQNFKGSKCWPIA